MHSSLIHVIARAVVIIDDLVLLAHCKGASNTFLPGGHIEYGETAIAAVKREVIEEFKLQLEIIRYLGTIEHAYYNNEMLEHEVNLCFLGSLPNLKTADTIESKEDHLEFCWVSVNELAKHNLMPFPLQRLIPELVKNNDHQIWFESTIKD